MEKVSILDAMKQTVPLAAAFDVLKGLLTLLFAYQKQVMVKFSGSLIDVGKPLSPHSVFDV